MLFLPSKPNNACLQLLLFRRNLQLSILARSVGERNYYDVLGISSRASSVEIKEAFYKKSKQLHPDNSQSDSCADFVELKKAYDVLRRPADRMAYDNRGKRDYHNMYGQPHASSYQYGPQYDFNNDWRRYWQEAERTNYKDSDFKKKSDEQWKLILKWSVLGITLVTLYNLGYVVQLWYREKKISQLVDEDEITKSFLRQSEFRGKDFDDAEKNSLARMLKADVDEAWRRRQEEMVGRNRNEIREEYRWLKAVQDADHNRRVKARRAELRRRELEERWGRRSKSSDVTDDPTISDV